MCHITFNELIDKSIRHPFRLGLLSILLTLTAPANAASAFASPPACALSKLDQTTLICDVTLNVATKVKAAHAATASGPVEGVQWSDYPSNENDVTAVLFLVDTSDPRRKKTVSQNAALIKEIGKRADKRFLIGVASFDTEYKELLLPQPSPERLADATDTLSASGKTTELYRSIISAVPRLSSIKAARHHLVVFSDGLAEDTAYGHEDAVKAAKEAGVIIDGVGFAQTISKSTYLQTLERMAEETGGSYWKADGSDQLPTDFPDQLIATVNSGGHLAADLSGLHGKQDIDVGVELADGTTLSHSISIKLPEKKPVTPPWYQQRKYQIGGGIGALIAAIVVVILFRQRQQSDDDGPTQVYGRLQMMDSTGKSHDIVTKSLRIGRNADCDIRLNNDSVSGYHAEIHRNRSGQFSITDLASTNGVRVNGEATSQHALNDGDEIELGEVRMRFVSDVTLHV